ncbi:cell division inhibitor [Oceanimonas sp. CHS3-5]|uniref:cell division inhibitor n=1 Tax=Oceanimonas sp. CHS3-5 TaxID=3068186 RepID=UPI00273D718A|nr:cell division inhibitor [Oceanimonas sp. CHS3-5]MDP5291076.1 cell division inhibitor [Oceanimonas sp. CHS3-5]
MMNLSLLRTQALISRQDSLPRCRATSAVHHASAAPQAALLARLAALSHSNTGWILIANAPGRLCRQTLATAGINPARIVDAHCLSPQQLQAALASPAIAAVVCWQQQDETFLPRRQAGERLFVIGPAVALCPLH